MKVTRLPVDPGPAAWNELLPSAVAAPPLRDAIKADFLVIGAGFAGLSAALRLRQIHENARIVVVEAAQLASGPAGRNSGFMIDLPHDLSSTDYGGTLAGDRLQARANRQAIAFAHDAAIQFNFAPEALVLSGKINGSASPKGHQNNLDYARHLTALNEPHEIYDAQKMAAITGTEYYQSGLFTPGCAMLQPALYIRELADALRQTGVQIYEASPVIALGRTGDWQAKTPMGQVTAPKVILAVNGHANSFGFFKRRLMHVFTYASMTRALSKAEAARLGGAATWGLTPANPLGTTVRRINGIGGDRIIIRNRFTYDASLAVNDARIARVARDHDRSFAARFPMLQGVEMQYRWGGRLCLARNDVPAFGELQQGLFAACCQNGLGTARGTLAGMMAADLASEKTSETLDFLLGQAAPKRLWPEPVMGLGANAYLKWQENKAGREL